MNDDDLILRFFLCIPASAVATAAVNPKGIKILLANGLIKFFIGGNPVFSNGPRSLPRNLPDCIILYIWVFDNLISFHDLSTKALQRFTTCLLVKNNLRGKLASSSPIIVDDNLKTTSVLRLKLLKTTTKFYSKTFTVSCEKTKTVSFAPSIINNTVVFAALN